MSGLSGRILAVLAALTALGAAGCGGSSPAGDQISGRRLLIYVSLPFHGVSQANAHAALNGAQLALRQAGSRVGRLQMELRVLDDSTLQRGGWDPGQTTVNARLAGADPRAIAYLGELDSGASAVSIPLLSRQGIPQLSPSSPAVGLTSDGPGASPGEPAKYYPTGIRTFVRVAPDDAVQAAAQIRLQKNAGCSRTMVLDDGLLDGEDMASSFTLAAQRARLTVLGTQVFDPTASDYTSLAATIRAAGADCVLISAAAGSATAAVTVAVAAADPAARLFGAAGIAQEGFVDPGLGGVPIGLDGRLQITSPALDALALPPLGQRFLAEYARLHGTPAPSAIFGYESMSLLIASIRRATHDGRRTARRSAVRAALFSTRGRHGAVGDYSITRTGDTTLRRYGAYLVRDGRLQFWTALDL